MSSRVHNQLLFAGVPIFGALLYNSHLSGNFNTSKGALARPVTLLDVDRIHIKVLIVIMAEQLGMACLSASCRDVGTRGLRASISVVASCRKEMGENAANDWAQEWQTRAHNGHIAFCSGPISSADVAV